MSDPVSAVTISDRYLVVARRSGEISRFTLPHLSAENTFYTNQKFESNDGSKEDGGGRKSNLRPQEPQYLSLNRSESKLAVVDANGVLNVLDLEARADGVVELSGKLAIAVRQRMPMPMSIVHVCRAS